MGSEALPSSLGLAHSLHRASQYMDDLFAAAAGDNDLTARQLVVLDIVSRDEKLSQTDICAKSGIDRSTIADMVRRLVRKGYLARRRTRSDARRYAVQLTDEGRRVLERTLPISREIEDKVAATLPEKHRGHFLSGLDRILQHG